MFKKFNYNLNHSPIGSIWGISLAVFVIIGFALILPDESIIPTSQLITIFLGIGLIMNFINATYILLTGEIKQINITYVCPTARKHMNEQEIKEIEGS